MLRRQTLTVWFVARDPQLPWPVQTLALIVAAYAFSPIDLIPDFIPVLGLLDDMLLIPLGLALVIRLTPKPVLESAIRKATASAELPVSRWAAGFIVIVWLTCAGCVAWWILHK